MTIVWTPTYIGETVSGALFFVAGFVLSAISLGVVSAKTNAGAARWLRWLERWKPSWRDESLRTPQKYRLLVIGLLIAVLIAAILVIPGIGEDRTFVLGRFYDLWGTVFYFYTMILLLASLVLIFSRRTGGYVLSLVVSIISIVLIVPDLLGLLPPGPPTFRTSIIFLGNLILAFALSFVSWKSIRQQIQPPSTSGKTVKGSLESVV